LTSFSSAGQTSAADQHSSARESFEIGGDNMDKDQVKGAANEVAGRMKRQAGEWAHDPQAQIEGGLQELKGNVQQAWGKAKDAARKAEDEANKNDSVHSGEHK
jgi:uncharacterized protein YjbJ (UPF0337 family)